MISGQTDSDQTSNIQPCATHGFAEILITAGGENVAPTLIEDAIKRELPVVSNAMVIGDRKKFLSCLLTLKVNDLMLSFYTQGEIFY